VTGWEALHVDELEALPVNDGEFVWRPVRRRFGITAFGTNAYTADAGQRVVEEHTEERYGHEELYVVLRGRATFTLDGEELDAPAGTLVFVRPQTRRGAIAAEDGTAVLGIGGRPGAHEISGWEWTFAALSYAASGRLDLARRELDDILRREPDTWEGHYNAACIEARWGDADAAIAHYRRAEELEPDEVRRLAASDSDLDSIRSAIERDA
jgi:quercetin dioxygenase-like cupin family protein